MTEYFKCIKTGCDILCEDIVYHGDLFYKNGIMILNCSGRGYNYNGWCHFSAESIWEIPCHNPVILICGKIRDVHPDFLRQIQKYESNELFVLFGDEKTLSVTGSVI